MAIINHVAILDITVFPFKNAIRYVYVIVLMFYNIFS